MKECLKQRTSTLNNEQKEIRNNIKIGEAKIQGQEEAMRRLEENRDEMIDKLTKDITEHNTDIGNLKANVEEGIETVSLLKDKISDEKDVREKLQQTLSDERQFEAERKKFIKELKFYIMSGTGAYLPKKK